MFRFTIRDLLWLTIVTAVSVSAYVSHQRAASIEQQNQALMKENQSLQSRATWVERLHEDAVKKLREKTQTLIEVKAQRDSAEVFWAEGRKARGLPLDSPFGANR
jgi:hypothetical protein